MKPPRNDKLNEAYESFKQDHDSLRRSLMAALDNCPMEAQPRGVSVRLRRLVEGAIDSGRMAKTAIAAAIIIAVLVGLSHFGGLPRATTVAWGNVITRVGRIDYVHVYYFKSRDGDLYLFFECWYDHNRLVIHGKGGFAGFDDGTAFQQFDAEGMRTERRPSHFAQGQAFLEFFTGGLLSEKNDQFNTQTPANVGDDFLIYSFDPLPQDRDSGDTVQIMVGRNSLLPIQVKYYQADGDYDLMIFDYESPEQPAEFFEPPAAGPPNGEAEVLLDGPATTIDLEGAPGLKQAVVRLYDKYDGPAGQFPSDYISSGRVSSDFCRALSEKLRKEYEKKGGPVFRLDVSFTTDEGYPSGKMDMLALWLNEADRCGTGAESGGLDGWPDGKYRNVRFSPLIRPVGRENTYIVEIRCRIKAEPQQ